MYSGYVNLGDEYGYGHEYEENTGTRPLETVEYIEWQNIVYSKSKVIETEVNYSYCFDLSEGNCKLLTPRYPHYTPIRRELTVFVDDGRNYVMYIQENDSVVFISRRNLNLGRVGGNPAFLKILVVGQFFSGVYTSRKGEDVHFIVPPEINVLIVLEGDHFEDPRKHSYTAGEERIELLCGQILTRTLRSSEPIRIMGVAVQSEGVINLVPGKIRVAAEGYLTALDNYSHQIRQQFFYTDVGHTYDFKVFFGQQKVVASRTNGGNISHFVVNVTLGFQYIIRALPKETFFLTNVRCLQDLACNNEAAVNLICVSKPENILIMAEYKDKFILIVPPKYSFLLTYKDQIEYSTRDLIVEAGRDYVIEINETLRYRIFGQEQPVNSNTLNPGQVYVVYKKSNDNEEEGEKEETQKMKQEERHERQEDVIEKMNEEQEIKKLQDEYGEIRRRKIKKLNMEDTIDIIGMIKFGIHCNMNMKINTDIMALVMRIGSMKMNKYQNESIQEY